METVKRIRRITAGRWWLMSAGVLVFLVFSPMLSFCLNIGSLLGMALGVLLLCTGIFLPWLRRVLAALLCRRLGRLCLSVLAVFAASLLVLVVVLGVLVIAQAATPPAEEATVLVLGCQVRGSTPGTMLRERLDAALAYLNAHPDASCVLSGGQGADEEISEAEAMYRYLTERGIDGGRLFREARSTSTAENLAFSAAVIGERGLPTRVAVVTHAFHQYRAARFAERNGLSAGSVNSPTGIFAYPTYFVREMVGIALMWVRGE